MQRWLHTEKLLLFRHWNRICDGTAEAVSCKHLELAGIGWG